MTLVNKELAARLRSLVQPDIDAARARYLAKHLDDDGMVACAITGNHIMPADGEMTYRAPVDFDGIVASFLAEHSDLVEASTLEPTREQAFRAHHTKAMRLHFVQRHVRLNTKKKRTPPEPSKTPNRRPPAKSGRPAPRR